MRGCPHCSCTWRVQVRRRPGNDRSAHSSWAEVRRRWCCCGWGARVKAAVGAPLPRHRGRRYRGICQLGAIEHLHGRVERWTGKLTTLCAAARVFRALPIRIRDRRSLGESNAEREFCLSDHVLAWLAGLLVDCMHDEIMHARCTRQLKTSTPLQIETYKMPADTLLCMLPLELYHASVPGVDWCEDHWQRICSSWTTDAQPMPKKLLDHPPDSLASLHGCAPLPTEFVVTLTQGGPCGLQLFSKENTVKPCVLLQGITPGSQADGHPDMCRVAYALSHHPKAGLRIASVNGCAGWISLPDFLCVASPEQAVL
jgi:hypothetical protein